MTTTPVQVRELTLQLPADQPLFGPVTRRRLTRSASGYALLWATSLALVVLGSPAVQAVGLGIALPGGGLLAGGHPVWAAVTLLGLVASVFVWWATGPTVLPPLVWLGCALASAGADRAPSELTAALVLAALPALGLSAFALHAVRHRSQRAEGRRLNELLGEQRFTVLGPPDLDVGLPVAESSSEDLARLRYGLDLALQPLDSYDGFTHLDQFREGALRYQLNALGYGLSMAQFTRTPAFSGYLAEAQRNAIEKMLQRKVWGYWAIENAWGNCRLDRDPVDNRDNIMLTGFYGLMLGMYESLNDDRYSKAGALDFRWSDRTSYAHDFPALASSIHRNMQRSAFTLFACEPNWIYTVCNTFGLNTMLSADRLHGTTHADDVLDGLRQAYDTEFLRPDGRIIGVRSSHLGVSWNFWASPAVQTTTTFWLHPGLPDIALRTWWLLRESSLRIEGGQLVYPQGLGNRLDPGSYKVGRDTFAQAVTIMAGREIGDEEYAVAAERTLSEREPVAEQDGVQRLADASGMTNHYLNLGRFGRHNGLRDLVRYGAPPAWRNGPVLAEAAYPDVLVAKAVTDGHALDLVLRPGRGPVRTTLGIERLVPDRRYAVAGGVEESVVADRHGRALVTVDLGDRLAVRLH